MKNTKTILIVAFALVAVGLACSFTTAKIDKLEFGKDEKASPATTSFDISEKVFAVADVTGAMGKHKMKFKVSYEDVQGRKKGDEALAKELDFEGSRPLILNFTVPAGGTYRVDATLLDEAGKEIDKKSGTVTVKGSSTSETPTSKTDGDKNKDADKNDTDSEDK